MILVRAHQLLQIGPMDLTCHHNILQEESQRRPVKRWWRRDTEAGYWGLRPTSGQIGIPSQWQNMYQFETAARRQALPRPSSSSYKFNFSNLGLLILINAAFFVVIQAYCTLYVFFIWWWSPRLNVLYCKYHHVYVYFANIKIPFLCSFPCQK